jgi:hypothetical protein
MTDHQSRHRVGYRSSSIRGRFTIVRNQGESGAWKVKVNTVTGFVDRDLRVALWIVQRCASKPQVA